MEQNRNSEIPNCAKENFASVSGDKRILDLFSSDALTKEINIFIKYFIPAESQIAG